MKVHILEKYKKIFTKFGYSSFTNPKFVQKLGLNYWDRIAWWIEMKLYMWR